MARLDRARCDPQMLFGGHPASSRSVRAKCGATVPVSARTFRIRQQAEFQLHLTKSPGAVPMTRDHVYHRQTEELVCAAE